jgi:hypothetical protein
VENFYIVQVISFFVIAGPAPPVISSVQSNTADSSLCSE